MRDISGAFAGQLRKGYTTATLVEVWSPGNYVLVDSSAFDVVDGSITIDGSAAIQRRLDNLVIVDTTAELVPDEALDLFSPVASNELRIYTGMVVDGEPELLLQGIFALEGCLVEDTSAGLTITLSAYDRARSISRARLVTPMVIEASNPPATTAITAISGLLTTARPGTQIKLQGGIDPNHGVPRMILNEEADPWDAARKIAEGIGWELFFDWDGQAVLQPVPDPNSADLTPVWSYEEGADSTLVDLARDFSNEEAYNVQVVTGANTNNGFPARGIAEDTDPDSPTFVGGPYGRVPEFWESETIRTHEQAFDAAKARLNQRKGASERMQFSVVPNPAHEVGDVVTIRRARSKVDRQYIVDGFNLGLGAGSGAMTITTRQRRV